MQYVSWGQLHASMSTRYVSRLCGPDWRRGMEQRLEVMASHTEHNDQFLKQHINSLHILLCRPFPDKYNALHILLCGPIHKYRK